MKRTLLTIACLVAMAVNMTAVGDSYRTFEEDSAIVAVTEPTLKAVTGGIEITINDDSKHDFYIYSITGQMIKSVTLSETSIIDLPQGCYIIKCENWSKKIVVR